MRVHTPFNLDVIKDLRAGMRIQLTGTLYTARDAAHLKLVELIRENKDLPFDPQGAVIYYVGPTPTPPGKIIGSAGPTTSYRMDMFTPDMLRAGVKGFIGKGARSDGVKPLFKTFKAVYCAAIGGAGALLSKSIKKCGIIAFPELGTEAVRRLEVYNFPVIVVNDIYGSDAYNNKLKT
ncbi:MAG: FumA C-terminus/TtdB family hydratase beta subunit [bacterium]